jgi:hypothetical protein
MLIRWREAVSTRIIRTSAMSVRAHTGMGLRIRQRPSAAKRQCHTAASAVPDEYPPEHGVRSCASRRGPCRHPCAGRGAMR